MALCPLCKDYPEGTACTMAGCPGRSFKIGAPSTPGTTGAAEHSSHMAVAPDLFAASVHNATHETAHLNRLVAADPFNLLHGERYG